MSKKKKKTRQAKHSLSVNSLKNGQFLKARARYRTHLVVYISNIEKYQKWHYGPQGYGADSAYKNKC